MPLNTDSHNIWESYQQLNEVKDTRRNRDDLIRAYGLMDHSNEQIAQARAKELIDKFTKLEPLIDPENDYFDAPSGKQYNPKDIFSWARLAKDEGHDKIEALQNFEAMLANLARAGEKRQQMKISEKDYDVVFDNEHATVYRPKSEAASCKLGAGTKWCTAATQGANQFNSYKEQGVVLFYVITKRKQFNTATAVWPPRPAGNGFRGREPGSDYKPEQKYAIAMYPDGETFQVFDEKDNTIEWSSWQDIADGLELPTDKKFFQKFGPELVDVLKNRIERAVSMISGQVPVPDEFGEIDTEWELLYDVLKSVKAIYKQGGQDQIDKFVKYRQEESQPDYLFGTKPMSTHSMEFFTDREYNPPGSNNQGNAYFQAEIVRHISRLAYVTSKVNAGEGDIEPAIQELDELTMVVRGPNDGDEARNMFFDLRRYVSRHMGDEWPELEDALIRLWVANLKATKIEAMSGYQRISDDPTSDSLMWLRMVADWKNGRWMEFETEWKGHIEQMIDDTSQYDQVDGILATGRIYNTIVNNIKHAGKWDQMKAWLPEDETHLQRFADGKWHEDSLPLTKRAERELAFRKRS